LWQLSLDQKLKIILPGLLWLMLGRPPRTRKKPGLPERTALAMSAKQLPMSGDAQVGKIHIVD
jgi:hypothetical protein